MDFCFDCSPSFSPSLPLPFLLSLLLQCKMLKRESPNKKETEDGRWFMLRTEQASEPTGLWALGYRGGR